jgi:hypothetical protein
MRRLATASVVLPLLLACGCARGSASKPRVGSEPVGTDARAQLAGIGSRSLTDRVAATYFIRSIDPKGEMVIDFVVFLKGEPGWTTSQADWKFHTAAPVAFSRYTIAGKPFRVELDLTTGEGKVLGRTFPTSTANIVVVDGFGGTALQVAYTEHQDLRGPLDADPLVEFLNHSPALQRALDLAPPTSSG